EYGVPVERPTQYGTRALLTEEEYARRLEDIRLRDERDLAPVDVLGGRVEGPSAPIPHWREHNTISRRTSLVIDPPDGRLPARAPPDAKVRLKLSGGRAPWDGKTVGVETTNLKTAERGASRGLRLTERFTRMGRDAMQYHVTYTDPATWTAPWTAALDLKSRP